MTYNVFGGMLNLAQPAQPDQAV